MSSLVEDELDEVVVVTVEEEDTFLFSDSDAHRALTKKDWLWALGLTLFTLALNSLGLSALEFFRHTEADRTLIAWDMYENGKYLVPQLVHSPILTKPPLYYWTLAGAMHLFGGVSEAIVRFPSVFFSALFVMLQFIVARKAGGSRDFAIVAGIVLATSFIFFHQATVAEIDLLFGLLSACAFTTAFLGLVRNKPAVILMSYLCAAVAFLAKGPPVVFFYLAGQGSLYAYLLISRRNEKEQTFIRPGAFILWNLLGAMLFAGLASIWLFFVASQVGWDEIYRQFNIEVVGRVLEETHIRRGPFFYVGALASGLLPWTPFLVVGLILALRGRKRGKTAPELRSESAELFIAFNSLYLVMALLMLSVSAGKSVRYIFPVHFCLAYLAAISVMMIDRHQVRRWFYLAGYFLGALAGVALIVVGVNMKLAGVDPTRQLVTAILISIPAWLLVFACRKTWAKGAFLALILGMLGLRIGEWQVFAPHRNTMRTVKPIAAEIDSLMPEGAVLYNVELFDRWINYYLKHLGRDTWRMSPEESLRPKALNGRVYLLLNFEEEQWRVEQLKAVDPTLEILREFTEPRRHFLLVSADPAAMKHLEPLEMIPTKPSPPFYNEPAKAANYRLPEPESDSE